MGFNAHPRRAQDGALRYSHVAIALHWAIAVAIAGNLAVGWWMHGAIEVPSTQGRAIAAFQLHKSIGLTVLVLSILRLVWRLTNPPPSATTGTPPLVRYAAHAVHGLLYALMIALPLSGWMYVSAQWRGSGPLNVPTLWFGWFEVPHLLGLNMLERPARSAAAAQSLALHSMVSWTMLGLMLLHMAAAVKHHLINKDDVLARMIPILPRGRPRENGAQGALPRKHLTGGIALIGLISVVAASMLARTPPTSIDHRVGPPPTPASQAPAMASAAVTEPPSGLDKASAALPASPTMDTAVASPAVKSAAMVPWVADAQRSKITFSGEHAGIPFEGRFTQWTADIRFSPSDLKQSRLTGIFETASATDDVPLHDQSLPQMEWFDAANHPTARFDSKRLTALGGGQFRVDGALTLKGRVLPISTLVLTLEDERMTLKGSFRIDRRTADLGLESDPDAAWVSREIAVSIHVEATRKAGG